MTETALLALHLQASDTMMYYQRQRTDDGFIIHELNMRIVVGEQYAEPGQTDMVVYRCDPAMVRTGRAIETIEILADLLPRRTV